jgi:S1-C subfamily serine protease
VALLFGITAYLLIDDTDTDAAIPSTAVKAPPEVPMESAESISASLQHSHTPRNSIETARNATVFIETEWGSLGSGFIVSKDCWCITNAHVMEFDAEGLTKDAYSDKEMLESLQKEIVSRQRQLIALKNKYHYELSERGKTDKSERLRKEIEELSAYINDLPLMVKEKIDDTVAELHRDSSYKGYKVSLIDDTEFTVHDVYFSEEYDLALFQLPASDCPYLKLNPSDDLIQGMKLFTIGNPSGLGYTVTAGIFSGYHSLKEQRVIQTDAPINPGNSGGPLISEDGSVVGVNTSILRGTEGIGFAITAATIEREFEDMVVFSKSK